MRAHLELSTLLRLKLLIFLLNLGLRLVLIRSLIIAGNLIVG